MYDQKIQDVLQGDYRSLAEIMNDDEDNVSLFYPMVKEMEKVEYRICNDDYVQHGESI